MTIKELLEMVVDDRGPILFILGILMTGVQISPIEINPWDAIFRWLGGHLNKEVIEKIQEVESRLDKHIRDSEQIELRTRRTNILDFSSSVIRGVNYHKEKFEFMINECDAYEEYCRDNNVKNGVADASIAEIRRIYKDHLRKDDFLVEKFPMTESSYESEEQ